MTTLYFAPGACSFAAHVILRTLNKQFGVVADFVKVPLRQPDSPIFQVNQLGRVPVLKLDDGELLTENGAILPYLGDLKPEANLFAPIGSLERARIQEWIGFVNSDVHFAYRPIYRPEFYYVEKTAHDAIQEQGRAHLTKLLKHIESKLKPNQWAVANRFTIADAYLGYFLRGVARTGINLENFPNIATYVEKNTAEPAVAETLEVEKNA